jgi:hypothetical protein
MKTYRGVDEWIALTQAANVIKTASLKQLRSFYRTEQLAEDIRSWMWLTKLFIAGG